MSNSILLYHPFDRLILFIFVIFFFFSAVVCMQDRLVQKVSQCSSEEFFNVNLLRCSKCESTIEHPTGVDYFSSLYPKSFNQAFSPSLVLANQNFTFNSHLAATSSSAALIQIQSNLEKSKDGLSCVCKKGSFRFKRRDSKLVNELICLPCPPELVSSLDRTRCSFCNTIPEIYRNNGNIFSSKNPSSTKVSNECSSLCGDREILVERLVDSKELESINKTALVLNYSFSTQFNITHLDQFLIQECKKCPLQTRPIDNQCKVCHFSFNEDCSCLPENEQKVQNGICIFNDKILKVNQELFKINYTLVEQQDDQSDQSQELNLKYSSFIASNFDSSLSQCIHYHNVSACQQLANFCVLNHYRFNPDKQSNQFSSFAAKLSKDLTTLCDVYQEMNNQMPVDYLPQIYFKEKERTKDFLFKTDIPAKFRLNERLHFFVMVSNAKGEFKESREIYLDELLICSSKDQSMDSIVRFAVNVEFDCKIKLSRLFSYVTVNANDQLFYELYLILKQPNHTDSNQRNESKLIYPIYVLNRNLLKNDQLVNRIEYNLDYFNYLMDHSNYFSETINRWQLVKRFFIAEQITSKESFNFNSRQVDNHHRSNENYSEYGSILRYVSNMKLMIRINQNHPNEIYPPILILDYGQVTKQELEKQPNHLTRIEFSVNFEANEFGLYKKLTIFLAVFCSLTVFLSLFRTWAWAKRSNHDNTLNLAILFKFVLFNCDYLANVFFVLVLLISIHSYLIYKFQSVVYGFLPSKSLEHYIQLYIILAFVLKSISILHEFYIRNDIEIFFIDWERSRSGSKTGNLLSSKFNNSLSSHQNSNNFNNKSEQETDNHLYKYLNQNNSNGNSAINGNEYMQQKLLQNQKLNEEDNVQLIKSSHLINQFNQNAKYIDQYPDVSIWRTLFVANEYCELSIYRRVSVNYHLFILLILLQNIGVENFVTSDIELNFSLKESQHYVSTSFTSRFAVGCLTFLITVLVNYTFTRYYLEPFVSDKISEFVDFCSVSNVSIFCLMYEKFGYYVHGRNPTGKSEVNMPEMHHNLLTEEEDLCGRRGLMPNSDVQCFQIFLTDKLVMNYKKIRALLKQKTQNGLRVAMHKAQNAQKIFYSYYLMNKLLTGFIDHMFVEMDYLIKERGVFEMLLDAEFTDTQLLDKSVFFPDKTHSFENVLFVGVELDVIFFELIFFTLIDLLTFNYIAAISLTFILNQVLEKVFERMARKNLIAKSLVDRRFLL